MSDELRATKKSIRSSMRQELESLSPRDRGEWSIRIADRLQQLPVWGKARTVLAFLSTPCEVNTKPIIDAAVTEGKRVAVPRMYGDHIRFHQVDGVDGPWEIHRYGIREPSTETPLITEDELASGHTLVVTPGCAFDLEGGRLGYGKGYYDRFITQCRGLPHGHVLFVAVCFQLQMIESVPMGAQDCRPDAIITENGLAYSAPVPTSRAFGT